MVFSEGGGRNEVGILVDNNHRELVVEARIVNDRLMTIKPVVGGFTLNIISAYAPQEGLDEEVKRCFWEDLDEMVREPDKEPITHPQELNINKSPVGNTIQLFRVKGTAEGTDSYQFSW
uniref:Uncharacterized protein n=1 Tax=Nicotiana tabacum TaxID=4097 RepID=A0A1S4AHV0_TOBAC|nr:PREDICTED: uncharacterized protein LOC107797786 [Nicotiana tabacum]